MILILLADVLSYARNKLENKKALPNTERTGVINRKNDVTFDVIIARAS